MSSEKIATPVVVPAAVLDGILVVRESGALNMFDRHGVARLAMETGFYEAAIWITENRAAYAAGIFGGFVVAEEAPHA